MASVRRSATAWVTATPYSLKSQFSKRMIGMKQSPCLAIESSSASAASHSGAEHVDHEDPRVHREHQRLGRDADRAELHHICVVTGEKVYEEARADSQREAHDDGTDQTDAGSRLVTLYDPGVVLGAVVEADDRLVAASEAQYDAEGEHHDLRGHADARQKGV